MRSISPNKLANADIFENEKSEEKNDDTDEDKEAINADITQYICELSGFKK